MRFNPHQRKVGQGAGNGFSQSWLVPPDGRFSEGFVFSVNETVPALEFSADERTRELRVRSERLSAFHNREITLNAGIDLPEEYAAHPERRYPVLFIIPGFGGTHHAVNRYRSIYSTSPEERTFIRVLLDPSCPEGHHVFADSAVNGPWGTAFIEEFLPELEKQYRIIRHREARFLTGHSSGGWSSLWMMLDHPEQFAGTWSTAPDPVTFRDFQGVDMYQPEVSVYRDEQNQIRPLARQNGEIKLWYPGFDHMETVLGHGGQLRSFEAVFGPRSITGAPIPAWNRETGVVDAIVVEHWKRYDIVERVTNNWDRLQPLIEDRIHVHMGEQDNFFLEGACRILKEEMEKRGESDAVTMHPGKTHFSLLDESLALQIHREISAHAGKFFDSEGRLKPQSE